MNRYKRLRAPSISKTAVNRASLIGAVAVIVILGVISVLVWTSL